MQNIFSKIIDNGDTVTVDKGELINLLSSELCLFEYVYRDSDPDNITLRHKLIQELVSTVLLKEG
jgi:hypothetical protein